MTVKLLRKKFAFSENSIMFASEIKNGDYLGYSFFLILISKPPLKNHPILVRANALRQDPVRTNSETSNHKEMKSNSTFLCKMVLCAILLSPLPSLAQFTPGLPGLFGIDGDVLSGQAQNITGPSSQGSFDWFRKSGSGPNIGYGVIDTTGTYIYNIPIALGQNMAFNRGMKYSRYSAVNGFLLLDARYARDEFGYSGASGQRDFTTYTSGSKNGDDPTTWITTPNGSTVADKADIIDTYIHMRRDGTVINNTNPSPLILALAANTVGNTGERYIDFELFRERVVYNTTSGVFSNSGPTATGGHSVWQFNANGSLKELGDMTVAFAFGTAGVSNISVYIWVPHSVYSSMLPTGFNFVAGEFYGGTYGYAKIVPKPSTPFRTWASVSSSNTQSPPWGTNSKALGGSPTGYASTQYAANDFAEVALDLTSLGIDPALSTGGNSCNPPFTRVMAKTRSSDQFTSALQDFTGPYEFLDAPQVPVQIATPANLKCNVPTVTLSPAIVVSGAVYVWSTTTGNIVSNPNATSVVVDKAGIYFLTGSIVAGCPTNTDSTTVNADYFKPVASASVLGIIDPMNPLSTVTLLGGDVNLSNYSTPYGGSAGLTWKWTGPNNYVANVRNPTANSIGYYSLELTETRNGCKDTAITVVANAGPLPVKYLSFDAVVNNKTVLLKWLTTQEVNNSHFEVERSFDMSSFNTIGIVLDGFINGTNKSYQFKDNSNELVGRSVVYYRLKQFDIDGKFTYSKVIAVRLQAKADVVMQVSPNPFSENLNVRFSSAESGAAQIRIVNSTGQTMLSKQALISKGYNNIQVEGLSGLATGMYVAQLIMNGTIIDNQRVIKNAF